MCPLPAFTWALAHYIYSANKYTASTGMYSFEVKLSWANSHFSLLTNELENKKGHWNRQVGDHQRIKHNQSARKLRSRACNRSDESVFTHDKWLRRHNTFCLSLLGRNILSPPSNQFTSFTWSQMARCDLKCHIHWRINAKKVLAWILLQYTWRSVSERPTYQSVKTSLW